MKILLTGATGYIGRRILPLLVEQGHQVICMVRDKRRFDYEDFDEAFMEHVEVVEADLTKKDTLKELPANIDAAYYLVHSMTSSFKDFSLEEQDTAQNFAGYIQYTSVQQIIYLGGIANDPNLSEHLESRKQVEDILKGSGKPVTVLRAAIIIGSGSASFEIIRDLVEKLPVMITPKWLQSKCQPISIRNILEYLTGVLFKTETFNQTYDIGGPEILNYREMLLGYARVRGLKRFIITLPVLTPRLSSLWLYFVTSTSYLLARNLVDSMKNEATCAENRIREIIPLQLMGYEDALKITLQKIASKDVISSWKDAVYSNSLGNDFLNRIDVPKYGCLNDKQEVSFVRDADEVFTNVWQIGGQRGWYFGDWLWGLRGFVDKLVGGVGLRRGRRSENDLKPGDALDFWRVLDANKGKRRLLLFAEMKLPGEAWLEFKVIKSKDLQYSLQQTATFRPLGIWGRVYWYLMVPFHFFIFKKMAQRIVHFGEA